MRSGFSLQDASTSQKTWQESQFVTYQCMCLCDREAQSLGDPGTRGTCTLSRVGLPWTIKLLRSTHRHPHIPATLWWLWDVVSYPGEGMVLAVQEAGEDNTHWLVFSGTPVGWTVPLGSTHRSKRSPCARLLGAYMVQRVGKALDNFHQSPATVTCVTLG